MRYFIILLTLLVVNTQASAQYYEPYPMPAYPPPVNYNYRTTPQYVPTIENNGPQVDMRRNAERMSRELENMNTIRNYQLIYGDTYRR